MTTAAIRSRPADRPKKVTLVDAAYGEIKRRILSNEFAPNFQITEGQLAAMLEMSRTPVHEAIIRLDKENLVQSLPRHGMRVRPLSPREMLEIYQVLTALELQAVELIALRPARSRRIAGLRKELDLMDAALARGDARAWTLADQAFHRKVFENCGNDKLIQAGLAFREQVDRARALTLPLRQAPVASNIAHRELVDLLERGDAEGAFACHRAHRIKVNTELTQIIMKFTPVGAHCV